MSRAVVALGGNTLLRSGEGTVAEERHRIRQTREHLEPVLANREIVFTHGNGPQVGYRLLAEEQSEGPAEPLDVLVAETQARVGYQLQQAFDPVADGRPATVVTRVLVDPLDPHFEEPSKPIGPHYTRAEAERKDFETREVHTGEGVTAHRRVVASPRPETVLEVDCVRTLLEDADAGPVICGGGGGVPVVPREDDLDEHEGSAAVVDKDFTSRLVAEAVDAECLLSLTDVDAVYADYGTEAAKPYGEVGADVLRERLEAGDFESGTMEPKVESAVDFVESTGGQAVITSPERLEDALVGEAGTRVVPS